MMQLAELNFPLPIIINTVACFPVSRNNKFVQKPAFPDESVFSFETLLPNVRLDQTSPQN